MSRDAVASNASQYPHTV